MHKPAPAQVSDIKRINGLLSDTAMFARDTLLIPKHSLPLGYVCGGDMQHTLYISLHIGKSIQRGRR